MKLLSLRALLAAGAALFIMAVILPMPASAAIACSANALRNAITVANGTPGADTIDLAPGCAYTFSAPDLANPDSALPRIASNLTINGAFSSIRRADDAAAQFRLFYVLAGAKLTLKNLSVSGGSSAFGGGVYVLGELTVNAGVISGNTANSGGGIYSESGATVTVSNSELSENTGISSGGGIQNHGTLTVTNTIFANNGAGTGGGIYGSGTVTRSTFSGNTASLGAGIAALGTFDIAKCEFIGNDATNIGGGILSEGATVSVTDTLLTGNTAAGGGAIFHRNFSSFIATMTITNSVISENLGTNVNIGGGGIFNNSGAKMFVIDSEIVGNDAIGPGGGIANAGLDEANNRASLVVQRSTVSGNTATTDGGGISSTEGPLVIIDSVVAGNSALDDGGGMYTGATGTLALINAVVSGNKATDDGGGVAGESVTITVDSSTIAGNDAGSTGGGIHAITSSVLTIRNAILWGNDTQLAISTTVLSITYTTMQGGAAGTGNSTADPLFVAGVAPSSAPTTAGDYHLSFASPAIDSGNAASLPADAQDVDNDGSTAEPLPYDYDGNPRAVNTLPDMGAFEAGQLLVNRDFEQNKAGNKTHPEGWTLKSRTGDKLVCDAAKADTGFCAFQFKGSAGEAASLTQKVAIAGIPFDNGDALTLSAFVLATSPSAKAKLTLKVKYLDGTIDKEKVSIGQSLAYAQFSTFSVVIGSSPVKQIKAQILHKSAGGKVLIDGAALIRFPSPLRGTPFVPPAVPSGLRGLN